MALQDQNIEDVDSAEAGYAFRDTDEIIVTLTDANGKETGHSVLATLGDLRKIFAPVTTPTLPAPAAATFADFQDTQAGGSVRLVPPAGVPLSEFIWKFGPNGPYSPVPLDGVITVGNAAGAVYAYAPPTTAHQQVPVAVSQAFTAYVAPTPGTTTPNAPTFTNFNDTQAGGSVTLVPASGVPLSLYLYKVGAGGTYAQVPTDGVINVGNVDGQVFAYSSASGTLNQSLVGASPAFTSYTPTPSNTTPPAPSFTNFQDTQAGGTVTIVPAPGVSMALVVYALPGSSTFVAAPADGVITVGNVAGVVQAKSLAGGTYNASPVSQSQAFTVYTAPAAPGAPTIGTSTAGDGYATTTASAPTSAGTSPITSYKIYRVGTAAAIGTVQAGAALTFTDSGLPNGTPVQYQWSAVSNAGEGQRSAASTAVTPTAAPAPTFELALAPGNGAGSNVDSLTYTTLPGSTLELRYNPNVAQVAATPVPPMQIFLGNTSNQVASLDFAGDDLNHLCGVRDKAGTTPAPKVDYAHMQIINSDGTLGAVTDLKFTSGSVLLVP